MFKSIHKRMSYHKNLQFRTEHGEVRVYDYSEKSDAVFFTREEDYKEAPEEFKSALKGKARFNAHLKINGSRSTPGWVVSKKNIDYVMEAIQDQFGYVFDDMREEEEEEEEPTQFESEMSTFIEQVQDIAELGKWSFNLPNGMTIKIQTTQKKA